MFTVNRVPKPNEAGHVPPRASSRYSVGKLGRFTTIQEAIDAVKRDGAEGCTIQVAAEEFRESVNVDNTEFTFPAGVKIVGAEGAKLVAKGGPALSVKFARGFELKGLEIVANGQTNGVEIARQCDGLSMANLKISGYRNAGIQCRGVFRDRFRR